MSLTEMGIEINGTHSYRDLDLYLADRNVTLPARNMVQATLPYMSGYYDFSGLCGGPYYGARTLTYSFDILADTPAEVEEIKNRIMDWGMTALESKIYDDYDADHYFVGSYQSATYEEDPDLPEYGGQITLTFTAQPYRYDRTTDEGVI